MADTATMTRGRNTWIHRPGEHVPFSGVYDVVDDHGRYLEYQRAVTQPSNGRNTFPELDDGRAAGYVIRAAPLNYVQPEPRYGPGREVPFDGIYDVVDIDGHWVGTQKVCIKGHPFPPLALSVPLFGHAGAPHGYALHLRAVDRGMCPPCFPAGDDAGN